DRASEPEYFQLRLEDGSTPWRSPSLGGGELPGAAGTLDAPSFADLALPDGRSGRAVSLTFRPRADDEVAAPPTPRPVNVVVATTRVDLDRRLRLLAGTLLAV